MSSADRGEGARSGIRLRQLLEDALHEADRTGLLPVAAYIAQALSLTQPREDSDGDE